MKEARTSTNAQAGSKHSFDGGIHELPLARTGLMPSRTVGLGIVLPSLRVLKHRFQFMLDT